MQTYQQPPQFVEINTALFVDFDNIFIQLSKMDQDLAMRFAERPDLWLRWLMRARFNVPQYARYRRNLLVRRCYLNPNSFWSYRPYFIKAGFDVVDCPPLTQQGKTSADIHMVLDIVDAMRHETRFDEFVIFSGDTDFTPVLIRLREHNRKTAILAVGPTSPAYRAASSWLIREDDFIDQALSEPDDTPNARPVSRSAAPTRSNGPAAAAKPKPAADAPPPDPALDEEISVFIKDTVRESDTPVHIANLADSVRKEFDEELPEAGVWPGGRKFVEYLETLELEPLELAVFAPQVGYVYDPDQHEPPEDVDVEAAFREQYPDLYPFAADIHRVTDMPLLTPEHFRAFFEELAAEVAENGYQLTTTSKNLRDRCRERGVPANRAQANFILIGIGKTGYQYAKDGTDTPQALATAFAKNVFNMATAAQMELDGEQSKQLLAWLVPKEA